MKFRTAEMSDVSRLVILYKAVARQRDGIARQEHEVTEAYIESFVSRSLESGLIIVAEHSEDPNVLVAEMHGYKAGPAVFKHVLGEVTVLVHPDFQGRKIGRTILTIFLEEIATSRTDIGKVELIAREGNNIAIALYQSRGFRIEGRLEMRIRTQDGNYEADIPMGWQNPNFEFDA